MLGLLSVTVRVPAGNRWHTQRRQFDKGSVCKGRNRSEETTREAEYGEALSPAGLRGKGSVVTGTQRSHRRRPQQASGRGMGLPAPRSPRPQWSTRRELEAQYLHSLCPLAGVPCGLSRTGRQRAKEPPTAQSGVETSPQGQVGDTQPLSQCSQ